MSGENACKAFAGILNNYEKDEIKKFDTVYYLNQNQKKR
jgi:hypothetical protein